MLTKIQNSIPGETIMGDNNKDNLNNDHKDSSCSSKESDSTTLNKSPKKAKEKKKRPGRNPPTWGYSPGEFDNTPTIPPPPITFGSINGLIKGEDWTDTWEEEHYGIPTKSPKKE
jgi:hypothetical protein